MKRAIVLGSGSAKGYAHIGVLKTLIEAGFEFDIVCGTSMGALVGAFYAANKLDDLEAKCKEIKIHELPLLLSPALSTSGLFSGKNVLELLNQVVGYSSIEELPRVYAAVCVDLVTSEVRYIREGSVSEAIRASISIPAVFTPVARGEALLVDGGAREPLPVKLAREIGADHVVAVDLFGNQPHTPEEEHESHRLQEKLLPKGIQSGLNYLRDISVRLGFPMPDKRQWTALEVIERTLCIAQAEFTRGQLLEYPADVLIQPKVSHVGMLDFHRAEPIIELGAKCAREALNQGLSASS